MRHLLENRSIPAWNFLADGSERVETRVEFSFDVSCAFYSLTVSNNKHLLVRQRIIIYIELVATLSVFFLANFNIAKFAIA